MTLGRNRRKEAKESLQGRMADITFEGGSFASVEFVTQEDKNVEQSSLAGGYKTLTLVFPSLSLFQDLSIYAKH